MWCDDFDCDLFKVVPEAREIIAPVRDLALYTRGHLANGKINHPATWNTDKGLTAFFGFGEDCGKPAAFTTSEPVIACTFEEAMRDAWSHHYSIYVEHRFVWRSEWSVFETIMYHTRKQPHLARGELDATRQWVLGSVRDAVERVGRVVR